MALAFRLYGHFCWPPSATAAAGPPKSGVVDVFFLPRGGDETQGAKDERQYAALRWTPGESVPPVSDGSSLLPGIESPPSAVTYFDDGSASKTIWLHTVSVTDRLAFRGAFLIEQYLISNREPELDLRLPLANDISYSGKNSDKVLSGLRVDAEGLFELRLNFPLAVGQSTVSTTPAFPIAMQYKAVIPAGADAREIYQLFAGWSEENVGKGRKGGTRKPLKKHAGASRFRLGGFGFSERGKGAVDADFVSYSENVPNVGDYWPVNASHFAYGLLGRYGFEVGRPSWLSFSENDPADLSLRFGATSTVDTVTTRMVYRVRVQATKKTGGPDMVPIRVGTAEPPIYHFKLLLGKELGGTVADGIYYPSNSVNGWLRLGGDRLAADCEVSWEIGEDAIWSRSPSVDWSPKVTLRLHWKEQVGPVLTRAVSAANFPTRETVFSGALLSQANFAFDAARVAMLAGEAGLPHSFLPTLSVSAQLVRLTLHGSPIAAAIDEHGLLAWGRPLDSVESMSPWVRPPMRLTLASARYLIRKELGGQKELTLQATAGGMTFFADPRASMALELSEDPDWPPTSVDSVEDGPPFFASFRVASAKLDKKWDGRLASLTFHGAPDGGTGKHIDPELLGRLRVGGKGARDGYGSGGAGLIYPNGRISAEFRIVVPVTAIREVGVDVPRFDRTGRAAPLLIPLDREGTKSGRYWLRASETLSARHDRHLAADIFEDMSDAPAPADNAPSLPAELSYVVISSEPFSVFRFTQRPLSERGSVDSAAVAVYSGDDRVWQLRKVSEYYHYTLPPQSIGESADKPRRLEIHDLLDSTEGDAEDPARPFVREMTTSADGTLVFDDERSDLHRRVVEQRLTPPADIWIAPNDVERGYFMPEAASYDIFRQAGAYGLGAALAYLRAEFLYGMPVGIDVSKEGGIARGARIAEIEALVGRLAGDTREANSDHALSSRWSALRAAVARRPERLEVWARDLSSTADFTPVRFSDGVRFALRGTALHRPAVIDKTAGLSQGNPSEWPHIGITAPDVTKPEGTAHPGKPRLHAQGLSGGALWPVESLNLLNALLEQPDSSGGVIEQIALSPLGGDATQKGEFLGGKVAIISETRNGRVQRMQVEVIGRICAFWHRAKHVVVYERTVNPSAQFAPKLEEDPNRTRSRRPILRKVREYIELLQPVRSYPDFDNATQRSAGFLERVRFNSNIINVDSAWSSEVDSSAWQIPLWNRQAARERPQVYPTPDVVFVSTAEGDGDKPCVAQECRDTDQLFFFADFKASASDTDQWKPCAGLDYASLPSANAIADEVDKRSSAQPDEDTENGSDRRRPAVSRFLPGLRRFTWRLAPAAQKAAINAGRASKPVYVGLDSVSFMRAGHVADSHRALDARLKKALASQETEFIGKNEHENEHDLPFGYWGPDGRGAEPELAEFSQMLADPNGLAGALKSKDKNKIGLALNLVRGKLKNTVEQRLKTLAGNFKGADVDQFASEIKSGALCEKLKNDATTMIRRKEMLISSTLAEWVSEVDDGLAKVNSTWKPGSSTFFAGNKNDLVKQLKALAVEAIRPLFAEASQDIGNVEEGFERARAIVEDSGIEIGLVIARARQRVEECNVGYEKAKPWSPARRKAFRAGIEACIGSVAKDIEATIGEAAQRLAMELSESCQPLAGHVAILLKRMPIVETAVGGKLTSIEGMLDHIFDQLAVYLGQVDSKASSGQDTLEDLINSAANDPRLKKEPGLQSRIVDGLKRARVAVEAGQAKISDVRTLARDMDRLVDSSVGDVAAAINDIKRTFRDIGNGVNDALLLVAQVDWGESATNNIRARINSLQSSVSNDIGVIANTFDQQLIDIGDAIDAVIKPAMRWLNDSLGRANDGLRGIPAAMLPIMDDIRGALSAVRKELKPDHLLEVVVKNLIGKALEAVFKPLPEVFVDPKDPEFTKQVSLLRKRLEFFVDDMTIRIREVDASALGAVQDLSDACSTISEGVAEVEEYLRTLAGAASVGADIYITGRLDAACSALEKAYGDFGPEKLDILVSAVNDFDRTVRKIHNDMARAKETAKAYADRVFDAVGKLDDGGLLAAPNNVLKLYSAVSTAPEIGALKADIDRIRSSFDELGDIIETTKANALFDRLSDELKAIGLSLPFDRIGESLMPADLSGFNVGAVFRNFGGAKLDRLFKGYRIPDGVRDAIKVTHDFDKKQARAWVQVDINAPFPGRRSLFSLGIFKVDFVDMQLTGRVRLEASKDQDEVTLTGFGHIGTAIDVVVSGQSMVCFEKFGLGFTKEKGLDIEFDPKNVRLNPQFQFIQDFLSGIFPELPGGMEWIKEDGIPVGVQHDFALPNLSLNFGTSGVSNISLANHFRLVAFPDFMLANRFNLSTIERPFIFSIFIIGGTGYIQVEAEYKPVSDELTVLVDAGAGGSASLAFAFGPFSGQVFITLSGVLSYRKTLNKPGGGLSISSVLVIAGHVDVAGIVTVGMTLMLRMIYRDDGQIDGEGSLSVTIRISRFFKITARADVKYKLRGGKAETSISSSADGELEGKAKEIEAAAKKLQGAMS